MTRWPSGRLSSACPCWAGRGRPRRRCFARGGFGGNRPQGQTRICLKILGFRFLPALRLFVTSSSSLRHHLFVSSSPRARLFVSKSPALRLVVAALRCQSSSGSMERSTSTFPSGSAVNQACARGCGPGAEGSRQASAGAAEASGEGRRRSCSSRRRPRWRRL